MKPVGPCLLCDKQRCGPVVNIESAKQVLQWHASGNLAQLSVFYLPQAILGTLVKRRELNSKKPVWNYSYKANNWTEWREKQDSCSPRDYKLRVWLWLDSHCLLLHLRRALFPSTSPKHNHYARRAFGDIHAAFTAEDLSGQS